MQVSSVLEVDGSQKSGSGTILRLSVALAGVLSEPLHIYNIRRKRPQPGLRPQHLEAVRTAAKICNANVEGASLGSQEIWFKPSGIVGGKVHAQIGTAGSIPMLLLAILPLCAFLKKNLSIHVSKGGTDVRNAPTINYVAHILLPVLSKIGIEASLTIQRFGYYPKGNGEVTLHVKPQKKLSSLRLEKFGEISKVSGISVCTFLAKRRVAERQAKAAVSILNAAGHQAKVEVVNDFSNPIQKGSSLVLWATTDTGVHLGSDSIGQLGKPSEAVGKEAAENLLAEVNAKATVDQHLADMLIPYVSLVDGGSTYLTRKVSDHLETNIWLAEKILGVQFRISRRGKLFQVEKKP